MLRGPSCWPILSGAATSPASRRWQSADVGQFVPRLRPLLSSYPELLCVVVGAIVGLTVQSPLAWLASHQGISVLLAVLVFAPPPRPYFAVALALIAFLAASAMLGRLLGVRTFPRARRAVLLTTSIRDFAIAADLAVAASGHERPRRSASTGSWYWFGAPPRPVSRDDRTMSERPSPSASRSRLRARQEVLGVAGPEHFDRLSGRVFEIPVEVPFAGAWSGRELAQDDLHPLVWVMSELDGFASPACTQLARRHPALCLDRRPLGRELPKPSCRRVVAGVRATGWSVG